MTKRKKQIIWAFCIIVLVFNISIALKLSGKNPLAFSQETRLMYTDMIAHHWDVQTMKKYATPEFNKKLDQQSSQKALKAFADFGPIKSYDGINSFKVNYHFGSTQTSGYAQVVITFERKTVVFDTFLIKEADAHWKVNDISSAVLSS
jgi:hypothetical protein